MRKSYLLAASAGIVLLSACGSQGKSAMNADLQKDLELASSDDGISLGNGAVTASQQFVSSIESSTPPARTTAPSARVKRHRVAPKAPPRVVRTEAPSSVVDSEIQAVATTPAVAEVEAPVSARPQPVAVSYPSGGSSVGGGSTTGAVLGTILGAVVRGGMVGGIDHCDERTVRRGRGTVISVNNRIPFPTGRSGIGRVGTGRSSGDVASRFPH